MRNRNGALSIGTFWRGHLFLFDRRPAVNCSSRQGNRLLLIFFFMEFIFRPLVLAGSRRWRIVDEDWWLIVGMTVLLLVSYLLIRGFADVTASQLGMYPWRQWSKTEKLYFPQIMLITLVVFSFLNVESLRLLSSRPHMGHRILFNLIPQVIWGFYQEFVYRGILQTELVRRWGAKRGILASNLLFTFGPLHAYHFLAASKDPSHLWIFAAIFSIGLYFGILFRRSGNLWMVGILHGLGDLFLEGFAKI
jgi:membrane protease YdiL (CAAX protease family)